MRSQPATILGLPDLVAALPPRERERFERIFQVQAIEGRLTAPVSMHHRVREWFGSLEAVTRQRIIRVTNLVTLEGASFNRLRARRPIEGGARGELRAAIARTAGDDFCDPEQRTTADVFGRVRGQQTVTAANVAKSDAWHGLVIWNEHDPLSISREGLIDAIETAQRWITTVRQADPAAVYPFIMWNCLWKAGASVVHGHLQAVLASGLHYAKIEALRRSAAQYRHETGNDYFADLVAAHAAVGLAVERSGVRALAHLTPIKEREIVLLADALSTPLLDTLYAALECYRSRFGVRAFNLGVQLPPIGPTPEDWSGFPVVVRLVDRGDPAQAFSDFGATELYAASVITSDPFDVIEALEEYLG